MTAEQNAISVKNLCKQWDNFYLDNVSFVVPSGRIVGFIGENGAGKSTTINLILNEIHRDGGDIRLFGKDNTKSDTLLKEDIGVVFDECHFHDTFTAGEIRKMFSGIYARWDNQLFFENMKRFKLPLGQRLSTFSKGMKMKLSIICAISQHPRLLILDEATTGLDPVARDEILDMFLAFIQDEDHSIFFSSHITTDIEKIADYVILIHQGRIIFEEQKDDLMSNYGIARCGQEQFAAMDAGDYITYRKTNVSVECLVKNRESIRRKYKNAVVDHASLEDIMLFYVKGEGR